MLTTMLADFRRINRQLLSSPYIFWAQGGCGRVAALPSTSSTGERDLLAFQTVGFSSVSSQRTISPRDDPVRGSKRKQQRQGRQSYHPKGKQRIFFCTKWKFKLQKKNFTLLYEMKRKTLHINEFEYDKIFDVEMLWIKQVLSYPDWILIRYSSVFFTNIRLWMMVNPSNRAIRWFWML